MCEPRSAPGRAGARQILGAGCQLPTAPRKSCGARNLWRFSPSPPASTEYRASKVGTNQIADKHGGCKDGPSREKTCEETVLYPNNARSSQKNRMFVVAARHTQRTEPAAFCHLPLPLPALASQGDLRQSRLCTAVLLLGWKTYTCTPTTNRSGTYRQHHRGSSLDVEANFQRALSFLQGTNTQTKTALSLSLCLPLSLSFSLCVCVCASHVYREPRQRRARLASPRVGLQDFIPHTLHPLRPCVQLR